MTAPSEIMNAVILAHRSPTYAIALKDGRTLRLRREADIRQANGSIDRKLATTGGGPTRWVALCGERQSEGPDLGRTLLGALGFPANTDQNFDAWWAEIHTLVGVCLALVNAAVPNERQSVPS